MNRLPYSEPPPLSLNDPDAWAMAQPLTSSQVNALIDLSQTSYYRRPIGAGWEWRAAAAGRWSAIVFNITAQALARMDLVEIKQDPKGATLLQLTPQGARVAAIFQEGAWA